jgi:hypothetical protein
MRRGGRHERNIRETGDITCGCGVRQWFGYSFARSSLLQFLGVFFSDHMWRPLPKRPNEHDPSSSVHKGIMLAHV